MLLYPNRDFHVRNTTPTYDSYIFPSLYYSHYPRKAKMLRQSIASLTRASLRTSLQPGTSSAAFAASSSRLPSQLRNYSEQAATAESTPGSEGAEAASSAQPEQEIESVQASKQAEAGKAKDAAGKAAPAGNDASAKQIEQLQKESKDLKVLSVP